MRLTCPYCGSRDISEFRYLGDASAVRPRLGTGSAEPPTDLEIAEISDATFLRENPRGLVHELWYHTGGCRAWIEVRRNTATHDIMSTRPASIRAVTASRADRQPDHATQSASEAQRTPPA
ncbi:MAG: sarcosine oxidase subunit delta [Pseudomonadota bacterium]